MLKRTLILFTSSFPYGTAESFLEYELPFLVKSFDKIYIINNAENEQLSREVPRNCTLLKYPYHLSFSEKIFSLLGVFNALYKSELKHVRQNLQLKLSLNIRKQILINIFKGQKLHSFLLKLINIEDITGNLYLYSYWMSDMAIACAYTKLKQTDWFYLSRGHGWDVYLERHEPPYLAFRPFIAQMADKICFISKHALQYFLEKNKIKPDKRFIVSYLGTTKIAQIPEYKKEQCFHIVSCSSVIPLKQLDIILESLEKLPKHINVLWTHLGGGPLLKSITEKANGITQSKKNICISFKGALSNYEVHEFYQNNSVDLFVNVSQTEGLPVSIIEAMSYGMPVVAPHIGGISEIVENEYSGFLLSSYVTAVELSEAIIKISQMDYRAYLQLRLNARQKWVDFFNADINFKSFTEIFNNN